MNTTNFIITAHRRFSDSPLEKGVGGLIDYKCEKKSYFVACILNRRNIFCKS
jgi:hypothetical protein